jgi:hypothetical protein
MALNPLFFIVLAVLATAAGVSVMRRRGEQDDRALEKGKTPGYSRTPGNNVSLDESVVALDGVHWHPLSLETFHSSQRSRLILSVEIASMDRELKDFFEKLAGEVQARTRANVVYLEARSPQGQERSFLYAPDGLGWSGHERLRMIYRADEAEVLG